MNLKTASWIIVDNLTGEAILETFEESTAKRVNTAKYRAVPVLEYLQELNRRIKVAEAAALINGEVGRLRAKFRLPYALAFANVHDVSLAL